MTPPTYRPALMIWDTAFRYQADISAGALKVPETRELSRIFSFLVSMNKDGRSL
jgi:hypothetical protein